MEVACTIVELLLAHAVKFNINVWDLDVEDFDGYKMIHRAACSGNMNMMKLLARHDFDINVKCRLGRTALKIASQYGHAEIVAYLLANGSDLTIDEGDSAFHLAARFGHVEVVREFIKHGFDINLRNETGRTTLHLASDNGNVAVVKELLDHGVDIEILAGKKPEMCTGCDCDNCHSKGNALYLASRSGHLEVVKLLLNYGAKFKNQCSPHAIHAASEYGHVAIVKEFLSRGASLDFQEGCVCWDHPPLIMAVLGDQIEVVTELLELGADVDAVQSYFGTAIYAAAKDGKLSIVKELLKYGANAFKSMYPEAPDNQNEYALDETARLLEKGYNANLKAIYNQTPLHYAVEGAVLYDQIGVVSQLLLHGADTNIEDDYGQTPFQKALQGHKQDDVGVVKTFLEMETNIDFSLRNREGKTLLEIAIDMKDKDLIRMITKKMYPKSRISDSIYHLEQFL